MKVQAEDLWPLVLDFIESHFSKEEFKSFKKHFHVDIKHKVSPLTLDQLILLIERPIGEGWGTVGPAR